MATLFDILGFLVPYIIRIKTIMQELWINRIEWDDAIPVRIANNVDQWFQELNDLPKINIPRCLQTTLTVTNRSIHVFTDASCKAYGAVAYQQCLYDTGEVTCVIIMSKALVNPLQSIRIPRFELLELS
ncbi:uncharacterized protein LOC101236135 [Hydra vulgaris]|uniref:uncharacterized protein LOC101236135 n=1 Tax=Hydra vulgaris TaxID=6087 RepID=UPI0002B4C715|nr:uncharacterized protein LOC101236135 [Hydra vulgaris]